MHTLTALLLLGLVAVGLCGMMSSEEFDPPTTFTECLGHMKQHMEKKMKWKEGHWKAKKTCIAGCTSDEARKCMDMDGEIEKLEDGYKDLKKEFMVAKVKAHTCLKSKCSEEPKFFGPCAMDVMHTFLAKEGKSVMKCMHPCMKKEMKALHKEISPESEMTEEDEEDSMSKSGSHGHGKRRHGMKHKMKHLGCLPMFCSSEQLMECAAESGLPELMMRKQMMMIMMAEKAEAAFKKGCDCALKLSKPDWLPTPLKGLGCDVMLKPEVCGKMKALKDSDKYMDRRRRFARSLYDFDFEE